MAKKPTGACNNKIKKKMKSGVFSESEIAAAEQLVQLSGESDDNNSNGVAEKSDAETTTILRSLKGFVEDHDDEEEEIGSLKRKRKKIRSVYEIYRLTKPKLPKKD